MAEINDLNVTDASNTARWPENMAPSDVNDAGRADEGILARWHKDTNGSVLTTGTSTAYVYAPNQTLTAYYDGLVLGVDFHTASGASPTINVDALGAKALVWPDGTAVAANEIATGAKVSIVYDGTSFQVTTATESPASKQDDLITTRGDIIRGSSGNIAERLALGASGKIVKSDGTDLAWDWGGRLVQAVPTIVTATASGTTATPAVDDSIPTSSEGDAYANFDTAITPKATANRLRIDGKFYVSSTAAGNIITAMLFQDAGAAAIAVGSIRTGEADQMYVITFSYEMAAGTTSPTTFKIRIGAASAGTQRLNGRSAARLFGGVYASSLIVTEIAA